MESLREQIAQINEDALLLEEEEFDEAIMGMTQHAKHGVVAVYDTDKIIDILMRKFSMTDDDAWDHFGYNILGAYVGEHTPVFFFPVTEEIPQPKATLNKFDIMKV